MKMLDGAWTAIVTPLTPKLGVDWDGLKKNVEFQITEGIAGVVPVGTTGESPTLDWDEHNDVVNSVAVQCKDRCKVLAGAGSNSTSEAVESVRHAVEYGADAVLLVDCYYNGPSSQELRDEYYAVVAREFPNTTIVPYIIPGRSGTALAAEDLALLFAKYPNINTVKEATGDLDRMARTRSMVGENFSIVSGDDDLTFKMMSDANIRANGVISVVSNVAPGAVCKMVNLASKGDTQGAAEICEALSPLFGIVTVKVNNERVLPSGERALVNDRYRNPLAIKVLMNGLGMPSGMCRKPLGKMSMAGVDVVRSAAMRVWKNNPEVLQPIADFYGIDIEARLADNSIWEKLALKG
ncbi:MAG: 4-hydroxy-tetrahydrodipicolinate synthase [Armatimonadota bacterium]|nr:4-hydroxy-tetrahydrodipicolinate synthase [bacterium]